MRGVGSSLLIILLAVLLFAEPLAIATPIPQKQEFVRLTIPRGTVVEIVASYRINSQETRKGEAITFKVLKPVQVGGHTVIAAGAIATGRVVVASRGGHFGRAGRLAWTMETVNAVDDSNVPIQAGGRVVGDSKGAKVATRMAITAALLWPIAPVALLHGFKRGENAFLPQGQRYEVTISADSVVVLASKAPQI